MMMSTHLYKQFVFFLLLIHAGAIFNQVHPEMVRSELGPPKGITKQRKKMTKNVKGLKASPDDKDEEPMVASPETAVEVGSKDYYSGFMSRSLKEDNDRVSGDALLGPTFKFVGGFSIMLGALLLFFMVSNGLI